jgi:hypothetical protein
MKLHDFNRLIKNVFYNTAGIVEIRKVFIALEEYQNYNPLRNDLDAYLYDMGLWALGDKTHKPIKRDFGL